MKSIGIVTLSVKIELLFLEEKKIKLGDALIVALIRAHQTAVLSSRVLNLVRIHH